ncbi:MAG: hypothetical protein CMH57_06545 [Myxococcales bacterium]|nr:hypothetical protein [Myxococcales bacterium]
MGQRTDQSPTPPHTAAGGCEVDAGRVAPSRRSFLKLAGCAGVTAALGAAASSPDGPLQEVTLRLDARRVRSGGRVPLVVEGRVVARGALSIHLVELDAPQGEVLAHLGVVTAEPSGAAWSAQVRAPGPRRAGEESYLLAAAVRHQDGRLSVSAPVEVICTPLCAGA